eukprot:364338-Chlamydomonas_euryale.AAC.2
MDAAEDTDTGRLLCRQASKETMPCACTDHSVAQPPLSPPRNPSSAPHPTTASPDRPLIPPRRRPTAPQPTTVSPNRPSTYHGVAQPPLKRDGRLGHKLRQRLVKVQHQQQHLVRDRHAQLFCSDFVWQAQLRHQVHHDVIVDERCLGVVRRAHEHLFGRKRRPVADQHREQHRAAAQVGVKVGHARGARLVRELLVEVRGEPRQQHRLGHTVHVGADQLGVCWLWRQARRVGAWQRAVALERDAPEHKDLEDLQQHGVPRLRRHALKAGLHVTPRVDSVDLLRGGRAARARVQHAVKVLKLQQHLWLHSVEQRAVRLEEDEQCVQLAQQLLRGFLLAGRRPRRRQAARRHLLPAQQLHQLHGKAAARAAQLLDEVLDRCARGGGVEEARQAGRRGRRPQQHARVGQHVPRTLRSGGEAHRAARRRVQHELSRVGLQKRLHRQQAVVGGRSDRQAEALAVLVHELDVGSKRQRLGREELDQHGQPLLGQPDEVALGEFQRHRQVALVRRQPVAQLQVVVAVVEDVERGVRPNPQRHRRQHALAHVKREARELARPGELQRQVRVAVGGLAEVDGHRCIVSLGVARRERDVDADHLRGRCHDRRRLHRKDADRVPTVVRLAHRPAKRHGHRRCIHLPRHRVDAHVHVLGVGRLDLVGSDHDVGPKVERRASERDARLHALEADRAPHGRRAVDAVQRRHHRHLDVLHARLGRPEGQHQVEARVGVEADVEHCTARRKAVLPHNAPAPAAAPAAEPEARPARAAARRPTATAEPADKAAAGVVRAHALQRAGLVVSGAP